MNRINCDHCAAVFAPQLKTGREPGGTELAFFICPNCAHVYNVYRITRAGRALRKQIDGLRDMLTLAPNNVWLIAQRDDLLKKLQAEITDLTTPPTQEPAAPR